VFHYSARMVVCGQSFSPEVLARIGTLLKAEPDLSRRALSRRVCEQLNWRAANGRLKDMSCRVALGKLARAGVLELAPAQAQPMVRAAGTAAAPVLPELASVQAPLSALGRIELVLVGSRHARPARLWRALLQRYHYLGAGPLCGAQLRYLVRSQHYGIVGALAFSAAAWRVRARDRFIGWSDAARAANLQQVVGNSRFLILPQVQVPHLASHVLGLCARQLPAHWAARYGVRPLLLETFVERARFRATSYRAANWQHVGSTCGRGRDDRRRNHALPVKDIYVYPLQREACARLQASALARHAGPDRPAPARAPDWAQEEFAAAALGDARLSARLVDLARAFYAKPQAQIAQACGSRAKAKAAYRFFDHPRSTMDALLQPHYQASATRIAAEAVVLAVQDTTSVNYSTQPAIANLGPIGPRADIGRGLMVHDTMAFTPAGLALGLIDVQCWARDGADFGKKRRRKQLPIEQKESYKWLTSVQAAARVQARCPHTTVVSVGDREADLFELFDCARTLPHAPQLLVRAAHNRALSAAHGKLWEHLARQPVAGYQALQVPRQHQRPARVAKMAIAYAPVELNAPQYQGALQPVRLYAVWARESDAPAGIEPLHWMLLSTCPVHSFAQAAEKLAWYAARWGIEVYHRTLKSGCRIETRQLGSAERIEACLAIDLVVAWRIMHLSKLGREHPDVPCTVYFNELEWKALLTYVNRSAILPAQPPTLRQATRMVASLGGFLGRKCDGEPGTQTLWLGLQRLDDLTAMYRIVIETLARSPPTVPSGHTYGAR
jgi:Domain of unknown function (DUF4338)/Transposase DNA-binding/Transposase Tn5 dimerisation domain